MRFDVISSGSKGNCTLIIKDKKVLIIDFGISKKRIKQALNSYGLSFDDVVGILITHNHSDHTKNLSDEFKDVLYASTLNLPNISSLLDEDHLLKPFNNISIGPFLITPVILSHDAPNTLGYVIDDSSSSLVYITDTGFIPEKDYPYLTNKDYYIIESNHDAKMLYESGRPIQLIKRITSDKGHLSNTDCGYYLSCFIGERTKQVVLAHLSDECNDPSLALDAVKKVIRTQIGYLPEITFKAASEVEETKGGLL